MDAIRPHALAAGAAALLVALAAVAGGWAVGLALAALTLGAAGLDRLMPERADTPGAETGAEGPGLSPADRLAVALAGVHVLLLGLVLWAAAGGTGLGLAERAGVVAAAGLFFGQVSHPTAHELIHRRRRALFGLGAAVYVSLLFGHHVSAHRHVHHRFVATADDPATARAGEGFYAYAVRAWAGGFAAGLACERARAARRGRRGPTPYAVWVGGAAGCLGLVLAAFGWAGLLAYLGLAAHAQAQILLADYVQHYGLLRAGGPDGRPGPVGPEHSWDAPAPFTGLMMLNADRHGDHHAHPGRPFPGLRVAPAAAGPRLPHPLPVMAVIALVPPWFRRVMRAPLAARRAMAAGAPAPGGAGAAPRAAALGRAG